MNTFNLEEILKFTIDLAHQAGGIIIDERNSSQLTFHHKNFNELVTSADLKVDKFIASRIKKSYPEHTILSEEKIIENLSYDGPLWIIDPIDGTVNYAHNHFHVATSLAFAINGEVQIGVVHCPFLNETFSAQKNKGAYCNQQEITISGQTDFMKSLIATGFPYDRTLVKPMVDRLYKTLMKCQGIRRLGSAAIDICWVAAGRLDGYYETLSAWDMAAATLIAKEAGAKIGHLYKNSPKIPTDLQGDHIVVSTPQVFEEFLSILKEVP